MRYLHYVLDEQGTEVLSVYSPRKTSKFSMVCLAKINNGTYQIVDKETNELKMIKL
jgi:hypothetical protein